MSAPSFFWYDYETFGIDPRSDRISQFAGIRTDLDFNIIEEPVNILCRASDDILPSPEACLITGLTPQQTLQTGLIEAEFTQRIHDAFATPDTCVVGFNNIRFDDEFTRYTLYRNFYDPYAREWQNGCSRWDIIDLVRMTRALRPDGIEWPFDDEGKPSNRLELITQINQIQHEAAHDALSDVYATIAVARLIREKQPRLYQFLFDNRGKQQVSRRLNLQQPQAILHTSGMYPSEYGNTAIVYPLGQHPVNRNGVIVYDLRYSPDDLLRLPAEDIIQRLYTPAAERPEGEQRIALKTVHINKCPVVAPLNTLDAASAKRLQIDREQHMQHLKQLQQAKGLQEKLKQVYSHNPFEDNPDPDVSLYSGGFFSPEDRQRMNQLRQLSAQQLASAPFNFDDPRIPEMLFRYRARNYPESLSAEDRKHWDSYRRARFNGEIFDSHLSYPAFESSLNELLTRYEVTSPQYQLLEQLVEWGKQVTEGLSLK